MNAAIVTPIEDDIETLEDLEAVLTTMSNGRLASLEMMQKASMHVLTQLLRKGCSEVNARQLLADLGASAEMISDECARRGLPVIKDPRAI